MTLATPEESVLILNYISCLATRPIPLRLLTLHPLVRLALWRQNLAHGTVASGIITIAVKVRARDLSWKSCKLSRSLGTIWGKRPWGLEKAFSSGDSTGQPQFSASFCVDLLNVSFRSTRDCDFRLVAHWDEREFRGEKQNGINATALTRARVVVARLRNIPGLLSSTLRKNVLRFHLL